MWEWEPRCLLPPRTLLPPGFSTPGSAPGDNISYDVHLLDGCGFQLLDSPIDLKIQYRMPDLSQILNCNFLYIREHFVFRDSAGTGCTAVRSEPFRDLPLGPLGLDRPPAHTGYCSALLPPPPPPRPGHSVLFLIINLEVAAPDRMKYAA